jgi:streptogramin lyase
MKMEQLSVGPDGTIYYSNQKSNIGRWLPPYSAPLDTMWQVIPGGAIFGIALDPKLGKLGTLYAGSRETPDKMYKIPLDNPSARTVVMLPDPTGINGVTLANDGNVYYTDQPTGNVYRLGPNDTSPTKISAKAVTQANDLAFGPDGMLYINQYTSPATIVRLTLQNGMEVSREDPWVTLQVPGGPPSTKGDGVAFDTAGNLYASAAGLYKVNVATRAVSLVPTDPTVVAAAGIEFGCGAMSCNDLIFSAKIKGIQNTTRITVSDPGIAVPWHVK